LLIMYFCFICDQGMLRSLGSITSKANCLKLSRFDFIVDEEQMSFLTYECQLYAQCMNVKTSSFLKQIILEHVNRQSMKICNHIVLLFIFCLLQFSWTGDC
uniref:Secreted protein n=1 Tax=Angiostrongylus cantonensis TaxID=6313 RepID=A0A0K0DQU7_ANGCA